MQLVTGHYITSSKNCYIDVAEYISAPTYHTTKKDDFCFSWNGLDPVVMQLEM